MSKSISEFFKSISRRLKFQKKKAAERNPFHDWELVLGISAIVLVVLVSASTFLYYEIYAGRIFAPPSVAAAAPQPLNRAALDSVVNFYNAKAAALSALENPSATNGTTTDSTESVTTPGGSVTTTPTRPQMPPIPVAADPGLVDPSSNG